MKTSLHRIILLLFLIPITSCEEDQLANRPQHHEYLILGNFAGECTEGCVHYYLLDMQNRSLFRINSQEYPPNNKMLNLLDADRVKLPDEDFQLAKHLLEDLPTQLIEESDQTIGCPDCRDQGGIYLAFSNDGQDFEYFIDTDKEAMPAYLQDYTDELKAVLLEIREK